MNHASATLQDFEHPLQKHPLNFTNIKQGNTFYSLTETQSLDFLLDVAPTTPPHTSSVGVFDNRDEKGYVNADSTIAVDPVSEPLETSKTPSSCATVWKKIVYFDRYLCPLEPIHWSRRSITVEHVFSSIQREHRRAKSTGTRQRAHFSIHSKQ